MTLGAPAIGSFLGEKNLPLQSVISASEISAPKGFTRLVLGNLKDGSFHMGDHLGSAMLRGLAASTGLAVANSGLTPDGGTVRWLPLP
ncbi:MAG: hypothetical protein HY050_01035 [Actinobacteria bacterium]|nr:hypothetical protein [Actinomycetota bacterium]